MFKSLDGEMLESCLEDASRRFRRSDESVPMPRSCMAVYSWPQQWENSACGFAGGLAMHAFWVAPTVVIMGQSEDACVYHNGRFVRHLITPNETFMTQVRQCSLPGARDEKWWDSADDAIPAPPPPIKEKASQPRR